MYRDIATRVREHWNPIFRCANPLLEEICDWHGREYPVPLDSLPWGASDQGVVSPETDFAECIANARSYAGYHLLQLGDALDHQASEGLRNHLGAPNEVIVVDVGCAAGILAMFADRCGFSQYVGIDSNRWMRFIAQLAIETTFNRIALQDGYAGVPDFGVYGDFIYRELTVVPVGENETRPHSVRSDRPTVDFVNEFDSNQNWIQFVRDVASSGYTTSNQGRPVTVMVVMNHLLFQTTDVRLIVEKVLDTCMSLAKLPGVHPYLMSIEPGTLYKPDRFGTRGLDEVLRERRLRVERYPVTGLSRFLTGNNKGDAAVRLVSFEV